jgi:4-amino-4-deoxy-L-arabinose transferase-like glycosyltransferase
MLLMTPLPLIAWATATALLGDGPVARAAAVVPMTVPNFPRTGATYTNDALIIFATGLVFLLLARVMGGDFRRRTAAAVGGAVGLALLAKGFALVLPIAVVLGYAVAGLRHRRWPASSATLALLVGAVLGAPFYLRNLVRYGTLQTNGYGESAWQKIIGPERPGPGLRSFVPAFAERFVLRFWGGIGYPERPKLPEWITDPWFTAFVALTVVGILVGIAGRWGRWVLLVPAISAVLSIGVMAWSAYHVYSTHGGVLPGVQGRYGYGYVAPLATPFALGLAWLLRERIARWLPLLVLFAGLATQLAAWLCLVRAWWVPTGTNGDLGRVLRGAMEAIDWWSPWPAAVTAIPFVLTALLVPAVVGVVFVSCRRSRLPVVGVGGAG